MKILSPLKAVLSAVSACWLLSGGVAMADATYHNLGGSNFSQDWSNTSLITT